MKLLALAVLAYALIKLIRPRSPQRYVAPEYDGWCGIHGWRNVPGCPGCPEDWPLRWDVAPWERA